MDNPVRAAILEAMRTDSDILIAGGGLNGPALALALASGGFSVTIVDAQPLETLTDSDFDGRAYALALASTRMLSALGIWDQVAANCQPILDIIASDGRAGEGAAPWTLHFDHRELEEGPMGHMLEDRYLRRALLAAIAAHPRIMHLSGAKVVAQSTDGAAAEITLADGRVLRGSLLIGCDGRDSGTALRAGIGRHGWGYDQTGLVSAIAHDKPHGGIAHQFFMPSGPLGILPLPGNRCSIVWAVETARAERITGLSDAEYLAELRPAFGDFLGEIRLEGARFAYPLKLTIADSFIADRLALVGDAAHGMHPLAGQGLNMGLRDVAALAEVLILARRRGEDIASPLVLERYQQWRRFDTLVMAGTTEGINRLFSNDNPLLRAGRDIGLGLVNALPGLRRGLMRQAAGLTGDLPVLMQGRAI
ncbi:MAG: UbiH/UbiF/VisC/COQ6 family ubiquinone biosynthesis hydroxylase [Rhodobacteraceae bacterium]|nr:UbiH/UbiF/VisC/COQ6 family ubiquinone biosynthesis hydroxylase [Paracoccaceae bacterium]